MVIPKRLRYRFIYVAMSQLLGLMSFTIVVKFLLDADEVKILASYQGLQAVTAFLMMSIQYSNSRSKILGVKFAFFFFATYALSSFLFFGYAHDLWLCAAIVITFACACYLNLLITALEKYDLLIIVQIVCSAILPFSMVWPAAVSIFFLGFLALISITLRSSFFILSDMQIMKDGRNWLSSLSMQAPLVLLPVFDPLLLNVIGSEIYRNYVILMKYIAGPINLLFSTAQFRILEKNLFNVWKLMLGCMLLFACTLLLSLFKASLVFQVVSLVVFTNFASLLVRTNNLSSHSKWSFIVGPAVLSGYYYFLKFSKNYSLEIKSSFVSAILLCIAFSALFSALELFNHRKNVKVKN